MRLVFLDVDGVLNVATTTSGLEEQLLDNMASFLKEHEAHVVFSSTWRYGESWRVVVKELVARGVQEGAFLGATADLSGVGVGAYPASCSHENRTHEILLWLYMNAEGVPEQSVFPFSQERVDEGQVEEARHRLERRVRVANFVCVDDLLLEMRSCYAELARIKSHQVVTSVATGFDARARLAGDRVFSDETFEMESYARQVFIPCPNPKCLHVPEATERPRQNCALH